MQFGRGPCCPSRRARRPRPSRDLPGWWSHRGHGWFRCHVQPPRQGHRWPPKCDPSPPRCRRPLPMRRGTPTQRRAARRRCAALACFGDDTHLSSGSCRTSTKPESASPQNEGQSMNTLRAAAVVLVAFGRLSAAVARDGDADPEVLIKRGLDLRRAGTIDRCVGAFPSRLRGGPLAADARPDGSRRVVTPALERCGYPSGRRAGDAGGRLGPHKSPIPRSGHGSRQRTHRRADDHGPAGNQGLAGGQERSVRCPSPRPFAWSKETSPSRQPPTATSPTRSTSRSKVAPARRSRSCSNRSISRPRTERRGRSFRPIGRTDRAGSSCRLEPR